MAPHYWYVQPYWLLAYPLVWAIVFIRYEGQCEKPKNWVRTICSHTFLFVCFHLGIVEHKTGLLNEKDL